MYESSFETLGARVFCYVGGAFAFVSGLGLAIMGVLLLAYQYEYRHGVAAMIVGLMGGTGGIALVLLPSLLSRHMRRRTDRFAHSGAREPIYRVPLPLVLVLAIGWTMFDVAICYGSSWTWSGITGEPWLIGELLNTFFIVANICLLTWALYEIRVWMLFRAWRLRLSSEPLKAGEETEFQLFRTPKAGNSALDAWTLSLCYRREYLNVYDRPRPLDGEVQVTRCGNEVSDGIRGTLRIMSTPITQDEAVKRGVRMWYLLRVKAKWGMQCFFELPVKT